MWTQTKYESFKGDQIQIFKFILINNKTELYILDWLDSFPHLNFLKFTTLSKAAANLGAIITRKGGTSEG